MHRLLCFVPVNFLTILGSHMDVTCSYFGFTHGCYLFLLFLVQFKDEHSVQLQL